MPETHILKTDTNRYEMDPYFQLDIKCRRVTYAALNAFRSRPTKENKKNISNTLELAYRAITGKIVLKDYVEVPPTGETILKDGRCPNGEHWNGSACEPDTYEP